MHMKLQNITGVRLREGNSDASEFTANPDDSGDRTKAYPEIAELLNAKRANVLLSAPLLARDELELANFIINMLELNNHFVPSMLILDAIRSLNAKLAIRPSQTR
jgi:hypothetical protein